MADIEFLSPSRGELLNPAQIEALSRAARGYFLCGYVGCKITPTTPASNKVIVDAGSYCCGGQLVRIQSQIEVTIPNCSEDVLYAKADGSIGVHQGNNSLIEDPLGGGDWRQFTKPYAAEDLLFTGGIH